MFHVPLISFFLSLHFINFSFWIDCVHRPCHWKMFIDMKVSSNYPLKTCVWVHNVNFNVVNTLSIHSWLMSFYIDEMRQGEQMNFPFIYHYFAWNIQNLKVMYLLCAHCMYVIACVYMCYLCLYKIIKKFRGFLFKFWTITSK